VRATQPSGQSFQDRGSPVETNSVVHTRLITGNPCPFELSQRTVRPTWEMRMRVGRWKRYGRRLQPRNVRRSCETSGPNAPVSMHDIGAKSQQLLQPRSATPLREPGSDQGHSAAPAASRCRRTWPPSAWPYARLRYTLPTCGFHGPYSPRFPCPYTHVCCTARSERAGVQRTHDDSLKLCPRRQI
jgi:hypothetical protein